MGYTHYWYQPKDVKISDTEWAKLTKEVKKIIAAAKKDGVPVAGWDGRGEPEVTDTDIALNGVSGDSRETFRLERAPESPEWYTDRSDIFQFCKTGRSPYDAVVVSILAAARAILGKDKISVSSDGGDAAIKRVY